MTMHDHTGSVALQLSPQELAALDAWIALQPAPHPSRPEAVRDILAATLAFSLCIDGTIRARG